MITIELTNTTLFKNFAEIDQDGAHIDLHNDFICKGVEYSHKFKQVKLLFEGIKKLASVVAIEIVFQEVTIENITFSMGDESIDMQTIDIIYRGRFENEQGSIVDVSSGGEYYYYITFEGGCSIELFAKKAFAELS